MCLEGHLVREHPGLRIETLSLYSPKEDEVEDEISANDTGKGKLVQMTMSDALKTAHIADQIQHVLKALQEDGSVDACINDFGGFDIAHIQCAFTDKNVVTIKKLEIDEYILAFQDSEINHPPNFELVRLKATFFALVNMNPSAIYGSLRSCMVAKYIEQCVKPRSNSSDTN